MAINFVPLSKEDFILIWPRNVQGTSCKLSYLDSFAIIFYFFEVKKSVKNNKIKPYQIKEAIRAHHLLYQVNDGLHPGLFASEAEKHE